MLSLQFLVQFSPENKSTEIEEGSIFSCGDILYSSTMCSENVVLMIQGTFVVGNPACQYSRVFRKAFRMHSH